MCIFFNLWLRTWNRVSFFGGEQGGEAIDDVLVAVNDAGFRFLFRAAFDRMQVRMMDIFDFLQSFRPAVLSQVYYINLYVYKIGIYH